MLLLFICTDDIRNVGIMKYKKIVSIDLDGVLNTYKGDYVKDRLSPMKEGADEFLENLSREYRIEIFTVRDLNLTKEWLIKNKLIQYIENITDRKNPFASVILDDRAIKFDGNYNKAYKNIISFKPYWKI